MSTPPPEFLTSTEVAARLRVTPRTVRRLVHRGELAAFRVGPDLRIPSEAVEALIAQEAA